MAGAGTPTGWRIVLISMVLLVAEPLIAHLRDLGTSPSPGSWRAARKATPGPRCRGARSPTEGARRGLPPLRPRQGRGRAPPARARARPRLGRGSPGSCRRRRSTWVSPRLSQPPPGLAAWHRGLISLAWALRDGDGQFGLTWHRMDAVLDTGPILAQTTCLIEDEWTTIEEMGLHMIEAALAQLPGPRPARGRLIRATLNPPRAFPGRGLRGGLRDRGLVPACPEDPRPGARGSSRSTSRPCPGRSRSSTASGSSSCVEPH